DSFEILREMGLPITQVRASGGGARSTVWRQILADVSGYDHVTINVDEGPAFGVALLAGVGTGVWGSVPEACHATIEVVSNTPSNPEAHRAYEPYYMLYRKLYQHLRSDFAEVARLME
ncbi:MAG: FGGY-family carbohydrate kinase, partial [Armatimonadetes bacterium]|nr:FGGY-family carbohydrate kinase [Armatimonadota bacterium]